MIVAAVAGFVGGFAAALFSVYWVLDRQLSGFQASAQVKK